MQMKDDKFSFFNRTPTETSITPTNHRRIGIKNEDTQKYLVIRQKHVNKINPIYESSKISKFSKTWKYGKIRSSYPYFLSCS